MGTHTSLGICVWDTQYPGNTHHYNSGTSYKRTVTKILVPYQTDPQFDLAANNQIISFFSLTKQFSTDWMTTNLNSEQTEVTNSN